MMTEKRITKPNNHGNTAMKQYRNFIRCETINLLVPCISESSVIVLLLYKLCVNIPSSHAGYDPLTISKSFVNNK